MVYKVFVYRAADGSVPFWDWLHSLRDSRARDRVRARLKLLELGHLGDWKSVGKGVLELRIHLQPGFRLYIAKTSAYAVVLLWGGIKQTQERDILRAHLYGTDFKRRNL